MIFLQQTLFRGLQLNEEASNHNDDENDDDDDDDKVQIKSCEFLLLCSYTR
jgi:hypothetical protein